MLHLLIGAILKAKWAIEHVAEDHQRKHKPAISTSTWNLAKSCRKSELNSEVGVLVGGSVLPNSFRQQYHVLLSGIRY